MKPTQADLAFWNTKRAPRFARELLEKDPKRPWRRPGEAIHAAINSHARRKRSDGELAAGTLLSILRGMRRRMTTKELQNELARIAARPGTIINPQRRAGYALKWAAKMERITMKATHVANRRTSAEQIQDFTAYLRGCTDAQVRGVFEKETSAGRLAYAELARMEAARRGVEL